VLLANPAAATLTGRPLDELVGTRIEDILDENLTALVRRAVFETTYPIDHAHASDGVLHQNDGTQRRVETTMVRLDLDDHPKAAVFLRPLPCEPTVDELVAFRRLLDAVIGNLSLHELLDVAATTARELFGADASSVSRLDPTGEFVEVMAASGWFSKFLGTRVLLAGTRSEVALEQGVPVQFVEGGVLSQRISDCLGPAYGEIWIAPITVDGESFGSLAVATDPGRRLPTEIRERLPSFVEVLTLAIEVTEAAQHRSVLAVVADHERIARDLHDQVIQRLIAAAMRLESMLRQMDDPAQARLNRVIDDLDRVTRDIRSTVYHLQRDDDAIHDLTGQITDLVSSTGDAYGLEAHCTIAQGDVGEVPGGLRTQLLAVAREALSNVGRHAHATTVTVDVRLDDPLVLVVTDDGTGLPEQVEVGNGLRNLSARATELGGTLDLQPARPHGTVLRWQVPWPPTAGAEPASVASL